jgi:glycosyltransferase involved in cell wall biosynthesis
VPDVVSIAECLLVPPGDPAALAAAIRACHEDPAAAAERANAASARVSAEFAVEPWIDRYLELYHSLHV